MPSREPVDTVEFAERCSLLCNARFYSAGKRIELQRGCCNCSQFNVVLPLIRRPSIWQAIRPTRYSLGCPTHAPLRFSVLIT